MWPPTVFELLANQQARVRLPGTRARRGADRPCTRSGRRPTPQAVSCPPRTRRPNPGGRDERRTRSRPTLSPGRPWPRARSRPCGDAGRQQGRGRLAGAEGSPVDGGPRLGRRPARQVTGQQGAPLAARRRAGPARTGADGAGQETLRVPTGAAPLAPGLPAGQDVEVRQTKGARPPCRGAHRTARTGRAARRRHWPSARPAAPPACARQPGAGQGVRRPRRPAGRPDRGPGRATGPDGRAAGPVHHRVLAADDGRPGLAPARPQPLGLGARDGPRGRPAEARPDPRQRLPDARRRRPCQAPCPRRGSSYRSGLGLPRLPARHQPVEQPPTLAQGDDRP